MINSKPTLIIILLMTFSPSIVAQVGDVNKNISKSKSSRSSSTSSNSSYSSSDDGDHGLFEAIFIDIFSFLLVETQRAALENKDIYPDRISFEVPLTYGTDFNYGSGYFQTGARFNWGMYGTDFKYLNLHDPSGGLEMIDWIVLNFRLPLGNFKLDYGIGSVYVLGEDLEYFKQSFGFNLRLPKKGMFITTAYQWTSHTNLGTRFKENFNVQVDYELWASGKMHLSPLLEYSYQNYFEEDAFSFVSLGMIMRFF